MSMSILGELAAQDGGIDWSRMNQPFGTLVDPNPVLHSAAGGLVQIRPSDIDAATAAAMGASGGGLSTKSVAPGDILNPSMMKARLKAEALHGKYPQYGEAYPGTGPADLMAKMPDPDKPGKFTSKAFKEPVPYSSWDEALAKDAEPGFFLQKK